MALLNRLVVNVLPILPRAAVAPFARPYVAGESVADVVRVTKELNDQGLHVALSQLGEFVTRREESESAVRIYLDLLDELERQGLKAYVHVKPTHLGLELDYGFCREQVRAVLDRARERGGRFIRMDMEDSPRIQPTLDLYRDLRREFENFGVVLQARMRRSLADARDLAALGANVRVCKGVYLEPPDLAHQDPDTIRENYLSILRELLAAGCEVGIATHDEWLVLRAERILEELGTPPKRYEFQMLHGVRPGFRKVVREAGHRIRVGVPFGPDWLPYSLRRLRKNPDIAGHVMRAVFSRG